VNAIFAIAVTSMTCAGSSTICARRQVTTNPTVTAHDPHQPPSLAVTGLTHPQSLGHRLSLTDHQPGNLPGLANA
jgi:hypothetical protein